MKEFKTHVRHAVWKQAIDINKRSSFQYFKVAAIDLKLSKFIN